MLRCKKTTPKKKSVVIFPPCQHCAGGEVARGWVNGGEGGFGMGCRGVRGGLGGDGGGPHSAVWGLNMLQIGRAHV